MQVELASWTGPEFVKSLLLKDMPELMRKDTEKLIDESGPGSKQPQRFTRQDSARRAAAAQSMAAPDPESSAEHTAPQHSTEDAPLQDTVGLCTPVMQNLLCAVRAFHESLSAQHTLSSSSDIVSLVL